MNNEYRMWRTQLTRAEWDFIATRLTGGRMALDLVLETRFDPDLNAKALQIAEVCFDGIIDALRKPE